MAAAALSELEALQVRALLGECIGQLDLLEDITPNIVEHGQQLAEIVGEEITRIIAEQKELEERYEALVAQKDELRALPNKTAYKAVVEEIHQLTLRLRASTSILSRNLKENPNIAANLAKIQDERKALQALLVDTAGELEGRTFGTLQQRVHDEKNRQDSLRETIQAEQEATDAVKALAQELSAAKVNHAADIRKLNLDIGVLKAELQERKKSSTSEYRYRKKEFDASKYSRRRQWNERQRELATRLAELERRIEIERNSHAEIEAYLERADRRLHGQLGEWNERWAEDTEQKTTELDDVIHRQERDRQKHADLTSDYARISETIELDHHERKREEAARLNGILMGRSALMIQRNWRGHRTRKMLADKARKRRRRERRARAKERAEQRRRGR